MTHTVDLPYPFEQCYRAIESRDARFDGWLYVGVATTGIYCRPSCPARTPLPRNVTFYPTAAAAQEAGFRACRRCRPDAVPGSPDWDARADTAARAMRLIDDGVIDRDGVTGLATRLGYTTRHLTRTLTGQLGAGPIALARARRAHTARLLLETTALPVTDVAFAAGFGSVRQFNDTIRAIFAATPSQVRERRRAPAATNGVVPLRLPYRAPYDADAVWDYLQARSIPGIEEVLPGPPRTYRRTLRLPHGAGVVAVRPAADPDASHVVATLSLTDLRDLGPAVARCRRLLHLDADPAGVAAALGSDPVLGPLLRARPGLRVPGSVDPEETAVRTVLGQQVSIAAARTVAARLVAAYGEPLSVPSGTLTHLFPAPDTLADARDGADLPMPAARARTLTTLARAIADGDVRLDPGSDRERTHAQLTQLPGIGPWTSSYIALRGLGDPDAFPGTDLGIRQALRARGVPDHPAAIDNLAQAWSPLRAYAAQHLWTDLADQSAHPTSPYPSGLEHAARTA